jgi:16S rRNA processing protein RimM
MNPDYLAIGQIGRAHGVEGELHMRIFSDFPERLKRGVQIYAGETYLPLRIQRIRNEPSGALVTFEGYPERETAETLRNLWVYVRADDRPLLAEGEYYHHQLIGLRVITDEENPELHALGVVADVLRTGANDVYVVQRTDGSEVLIPALDETVLEVDLERGEMRVHLLPGLLH